MASVDGPEGSVDEAASSESGQGLVEYGLIIFLVAIVVIAILLLVGPRIGSIFSRITQLG
jgi:pilus assembly protein Flp/PilA